MANKRATILIADDSPDILRFIKVNLQFEGYRAITATDGKQALKIAQAEKPDLVILDVIMPEMDGWQVLSHLKNDPSTKDIPVILLTSGYVEKDANNRACIEGVEDFISKPFNPLRLVESVESIIFARQMSRPLIEKKTTRPIRFGLIGQEGRGLEIVKTFSGSSTVELAAYCPDRETSDSSRLVKELGIPLWDAPIRLLKEKDLDLIIDTRDQVDTELAKLARQANIEILQGIAVDVFVRLMKEQEESRQKERSLVKELNARVKELSILNDLYQILTSPLDLWLLLERIAHLAIRVANVDSFGVFVYNEEQEKFIVSNTFNISEDFKSKVKLSLSDPMVEELMAFRRPMVVGPIKDWGISPLIREALHEGKSCLANVPLFSKERLLGFISMFSTESDVFNEKDLELLSLLAGQSGIAIENAYLYETTRKKQNLVERLLSKLIQAQEEERKRIAAEIHDTIAQSLVSIHTRVQTCLSLLTKAPDKLGPQLEDLKKVVADNVKEVRQIIFNLRPSSLDDLGLIPSLENYIKRFEKEQGIFVEFLINKRDLIIPPTVETAVFRIIQEALTNVKKHSEGRSVLVRLNIDPKSLSLRVSDDGKGFQWEEVTEKFLRGDSHGLQGMKERVSLLGGTFRITTAEGKGCVVSATIPFTRKPEERIIPEMKEVLGRW